MIEEASSAPPPSSSSSSSSTSNDEKSNAVTSYESSSSSSSAPLTPTSVNRTFAPLNIPLSRRRETFTLLVWFLIPWTCLYLSLVLLRCNNWYIVSAFIVYLTWMMFFQRYPREGGHRQQWFRRLGCWTWFAGRHPPPSLPSSPSFLA